MAQPLNEPATDAPVSVASESHRPMAAPTGPHETIVIEPPRGISFPFAELWSYRELAWFLVLRSIKPRYRQTLLGVGWAVIPPVMLTIVFTVFLHRVAGIRGESGIPYPIFAYSGLLIWQFFANATTRGATSLLGNAQFLTKVYFPRLLVPSSTVLAALFDLAVAFVVLVPLMAYYGFAPGIGLLALPAFLLLAIAAALAVSLWLAAASVQYRDLSHAIPLVVQVWLFATPVVYPVSVFPETWRTVIEVLNPMAPVVEGFRWAILAEGTPPIWETLGAAAVTLVALVGGIAFFSRMERTFADEI